MKKIYFIFFLSVCYFSSLFCKLLEVKHFAEVVSFIEPDTLLVCDIDDTLLLPKQTLGNDAWFQHRLREHESRGMEKKRALEQAIAEWEAIRHLTDVQIVEDGSDEIIRNLQDQNVAIMGLTTQGLALATRTAQQLGSLNIDLKKTAPYQDDCYFINGHGVLYRQGLLFTSGTPKGKALLKFFDLIGWTPKRVVFINDKETHLVDVETSLLNQGIDFVGLRYSYGDERVADFSAEIAEIQWVHSTFGHLLSDEEAERLMLNVSENVDLRTPL